MFVDFKVSAMSCAIRACLCIVPVSAVGCVEIILEMIVGM